MKEERILDVLGNVDEKYIKEADPEVKTKRKALFWTKVATIAACLCIVLSVCIRMGNNSDYVPLNINTITDASYSAPAITSTIETVQVSQNDADAWLEFNLHENMPAELKDFSLKYYFVQDNEIDETLGVEIWGKVEDAETPRPQFRIAITEGKVLQDLLFDYDVTTDIDGVTVIAGVMPGETKINRDEEEIYIPAKYFSLFDVGMYHCAVETQGQVSEEAFSELNNIIIDLLLRK